LYKDEKANKLRSYEKLLRRVKQEKNPENIKKIISDYENEKGVI